MQIYEPIDKLPLYGQDPLNALQSKGTHYVATGDSGQGTTGGTIAGKLIADQILGIPNAWTKASPCAALQIMALVHACLLQQKQIARL